MRNPHFFQKSCHFLWNHNKISKNDNTYERNEDCATVFLKWTDFSWALINHSKASKKVVFENDFFHIFEYFNGYDCFFSWRSIKAVAGAHFSCISRKWSRCVHNFPVGGTTICPPPLIYSPEAKLYYWNYFIESNLFWIRVLRIW